MPVNLFCTSTASMSSQRIKLSLDRLLLSTDFLKIVRIFSKKIKDRQDPKRLVEETVSKLKYNRNKN